MEAPSKDKRCVQIHLDVGRQLDHVTVLPHLVEHFFVARVPPTAQGLAEAGGAYAAIRAIRGELVVLAGGKHHNIARNGSGGQRKVFFSFKIVFLFCPCLSARVDFNS